MVLHIDLFFFIPNLVSIFCALRLYRTFILLGYSGDNCEFGTTVVLSTAELTSAMTTEYTNHMTTILTTELTTGQTTIVTLGPCVPADNCAGHFNCSGDVRVCLDGYSGDDCNTKDIDASSDDPDCFLGISSSEACTGLGYCFQGACCCEDDEFDNANKCFDFNECDSSPCLNSGTCINQAGSYLCICNNGMSSMLTRRHRIVKFHKLDCWIRTWYVYL